MKNLFILLIAIIILGCATEPETPIPNITDYPKPTNEKELSAECLNIRNEINRQRAIAQYARSRSLIIAAYAQRKSAENIAWYEGRSAYIGCPGAFSGTVIHQKGDLTFDECFEKCKKLTRLNDEQCFDKCNK